MLAKLYTWGNKWTQSKWLQKLDATLERWSENKRLNRLVRSFLWVTLIVFTIDFLYQTTQTFQRWTSFDFLFNYSGGFIRRGLLGTWLLWLHDTFGVWPFAVIKRLCIWSFLLIAAYFVWQFRRRGYNWYLLLAPFMIGDVAITSLQWHRRAFLLFCLLAVVAHCYNRIGLRGWLVLGNIICCFCILNHEPFFFYSVPIFILMTKLKGLSWAKAILTWAPSFAAFALCCIFKGTPEQQIAIRSSVDMLIPEGREDMAFLITYIGKDASGVLLGQTLANTLGAHNSFPTFIVNGVSAWCVYHLACNAIYVLSPGKLSKRSRDCLVRIVQIQLVFLLPMFLVLAVDYGRTVMYWIMSSYILWFSLKESQVERLLPPPNGKMESGRGSCGVARHSALQGYMLDTVAYCQPHQREPSLRPHPHA